jgi:26S proteasome regulatory subunit N11
VKGKVVIDCFRLINPQLMMLGQEPRQTTSNVGHLKKPSIQALIHGLNRHYYSMVPAVGLFTFSEASITGDRLS